MIASRFVPIVLLALFCCVAGGCHTHYGNALKKFSHRPAPATGDLWRVHAVGNYQHDDYKFKRWDLVGEVVLKAPDADKAARTATWMLRMSTSNVPKGGSFYDMTATFVRGAWFKVVAVERDADCTDWTVVIRRTWRRPVTGAVEAVEETSRIRANGEASARLKAASPVPPEEGGGTDGFSVLLKTELISITASTTEDIAKLPIYYQWFDKDSQAAPASSWRPTVIDGTPAARR